MNKQDWSNVLSIFRRFDENCDGYVTYREMATILRKLDKDKWTENTIRSLFLGIDLNRDEQISVDDFTEWAFKSDSGQAVSELERYMGTSQASLSRSSSTLSSSFPYFAAHMALDRKASGANSTKTHGVQDDTSGGNLDAVTHTIVVQVASITGEILSEVSLNNRDTIMTLRDSVEKECACQKGHVWNFVLEDRILDMSVPVSHSGLVDGIMVLASPVAEPGLQRLLRGFKLLVGQLKTSADKDGVDDYDLSDLPLLFERLAHYGITMESSRRPMQSHVERRAPGRSILYSSQGIFTSLLASKNPILRVLGLWTLAGFGPAALDMIPEMAGFLNDVAHNVRTTALVSLYSLLAYAPQQVFPILITAVDNRDVDIKCGAMMFLLCQDFGRSCLYSRTHEYVDYAYNDYSLLSKLERVFGIEFAMRRYQSPLWYDCEDLKARAVEVCTRIAKEDGDRRARGVAILFLRTVIGSRLLWRVLQESDSWETQHQRLSARLQEALSARENAKHKRHGQFAKMSKTEEERVELERVLERDTLEMASWKEARKNHGGDVNCLPFRTRRDIDPVCLRVDLFSAVSKRVTSQQERGRAQDKTVKSQKKAKAKAKTKAKERRSLSPARDSTPRSARMRGPSLRDSNTSVQCDEHLDTALDTSIEGEAAWNCLPIEVVVGDTDPCFPSQGESDKGLQGRRRRARALRTYFETYKLAGNRRPPYISYFFSKLDKLAGKDPFDEWIFPDKTVPPTEFEHAHASFMRSFDDLFETRLRWLDEKALRHLDDRDPVCKDGESEDDEEDEYFEHALCTYRPLPQVLKQIFETGSDYEDEEEEEEDPPEEEVDDDDLEEILGLFD